MDDGGAAHSGEASEVESVGSGELDDDAYYSMYPERSPAPMSTGEWVRYVAFLALLPGVVLGGALALIIFGSEPDAGPQSASASSAGASSSSTVGSGTTSSVARAGGASNVPRDPEQKQRDDEARAEAMAIVTSYTRPAADVAAWRHALRPHLSGDAAKALVGACPGATRAREVTGPGVVRPMREPDVREVAVPTDAGVTTVTLHHDVATGRWVATSMARPGENALDRR